VLKGGAWYLAARPVGRDEVRTYRLASVLEIGAPGRTFKRPRGFDLAAYWRASAERFEAELRRLQARVRISPRALNWLHNARDKYFPAEAARDAAPLREGWHEVLMPIESIEHGARRLLWFGPEVEVVEPAALRDAVRAQARALLALYETERRTERDAERAPEPAPAPAPPLTPSAAARDARASRAAAPAPARAGRRAGARRARRWPGPGPRRPRPSAPGSRA